MRTGLCILAICGLGARGWGQVRPANYEDDVKAIFARRCLGCHNAGEMRAGLNLESFAGVLKGGGSGDAVIAGRASGSLLYRAVAREDGAPQMPLGQAKLPDGEISTIREWIQQGLLETAVSTPRGAAALSLEYKPGDWNRAGGPAAMPESLAAVTVAETGRAQPVAALAGSPGGRRVGGGGRGGGTRGGGPAAMPESLAAVTVAETGRAQPVTALAASPWAPLVAVAGH